MEPDDVHSADQGPTKGGISVITIFGARLYGTRSSGRKKTSSPQNSGASGGGGSGDSGRVEEEDAVQTGGCAGGDLADIQGENATDRGAGDGAEEVLRRRQAGVQLGKRSRESRRTEEYHQAPGGVEAAPCTGVGGEEDCE